MSLLETIKKPSDLRALTLKQLTELAEEIRAFLIANVARTGGHLGPNLGVVELTLAIHRVFESPKDSIVFDTGHQSYVHKLVTGRQDFQTLRQQDGLSGYPDRGESEHDIVESSHASSSLSWVDGISRANKLRGFDDRYAVALVGDGALTGGMAWEAANNIAGDKDRKAIIVVNDNGRSYAPTIGGLANQLSGLRQQLDKVRTHPAYENAMDKLKDKLKDSGPVGSFTYKSLHATKKGIKDWWAPQGLFEDLGIKYIGPIDGHNLAAVEEALQQAKQYGGPVLVHTLTEKGHGYAPALADEDDQFHAVGVIDPATGKPISTSSAQSWTSVFGDEIAKIADEREDVVAITGAMLLPVGLKKMSEAHPERVIDVGIAEQHAMTTAAGLAYGGLHPVVCVYATFLNRAFDQLLMDVALHKAGVTIVLDRAGVTGPDGASHHGMWDMALTQIVPNLRLAAPRDATRLREELRESMDVTDAPTVVRFSKGSVGEEVAAIDRLPDGVDVLARLGDRSAPDVLIISVGAMSELSLDVAQRLNSQGVSVTVIDPRWVLPMPQSVISLAARHRIVVCIEDGVRAGGVGSRLRTEMRAAGVDTALNEVGLPTSFLTHGSREQVMERVGLTAQQVARDTLAQVLGTKVPFARPLPGQELPTGQIPKL
ncbi:1-deoxy-D-xylulose-5-phosphate synthase 2 [Glutamicibacter uratoxydans]|uniref:1-deoxy-D-xylulose-5-phosphate synthase n=1 Tax=Glutamicibacter uratoxydans TaxID=43667 RepID=A0A4Y4DQ94_GLUUR|nr:1-deoxy-D-xylulose-5-phosphate synthase [Glutamicibacter uratoxydans]GED07512.1 1-deoxy-D-xylulose-5-phosphate synthase 2 [Glutamicibacter uratoxydans]